MKSDSRFIIKVLILTLQKIINAREGRVTTKKADLKRGSDLKRCVHDSTDDGGKYYKKYTSITY